MLNKKTKKHISILMATVICMSFLWTAPFAFSEDLISIQAVFTDPVFNRIVRDYDRNGDGYLSATERNINYMNISAKIETNDEGDPIETIDNLDGIEYFTNISTLRCGSLGLTRLDVSNLPNLVDLSCQGNNIGTLDLSYNSNLVTVNCSDNLLTSILLPVGAKLKNLSCQINNLTTLNVSGSKGLEKLYCHQNSLSVLDLTNNTSLFELNCQQNNLTSLDLSRTALSSATPYKIGGQTVTVKATTNGDSIIIPFRDKGVSTVTNFRGCSLDEYSDESGFFNTEFIAYDVAQVDNGIKYECFPMLDGASNMDVLINVVRDFYQVDFFSDDTMEKKVSTTFVNNGSEANAVIASPTPCKVFDHWSSDVSAVTSDMQTYAVWRDVHTYVPFAIAADKDRVTVRCSACGNSDTKSFKTLINSTSADAKFDASFDVVKDGVINAKDFSKLLQIL